MVVNQFHDSAHQQMRQAALDVAAEEVLANGWDGLQMRAVATRIGVARQTLYNAFGNKHGLASELMQRVLSQFLNGIDTAVAAEDTLHARWATVVRYTLENAVEDTLLVAFLTGTSSDEFLPLLTSNSTAVISRARDHLTATIGGHHPDLERETLSRVAETVTRMIISHVVQPMHPPVEVAEHVADLATAGCTLRVTAAVA